MKPGLIPRLLLIAMGLCTGPQVQAAEPIGLLRAFETGTVIFDTAHNNCIRLNVWFANTPEQQRQGLMFIKRLDEFEGMLFRYPRDAVIRMWMKNTFIPLDMLFIDAGNRISSIETHTEPMSERIISSRKPVRAVLELNAGSAGRWGLQSGRRLLLVDSRDTG